MKWIISTTNIGNNPKWDDEKRLWKLKKHYRHCLAPVLKDISYLEPGHWTTYVEKITLNSKEKIESENENLKVEGQRY